METSIIQIILDPSPYLHVFQKYLQKIVFKHITCFINKHDVLNPQQYGFQKGISMDFKKVSPQLMLFLIQ